METLCLSDEHLLNVVGMSELVARERSESEVHHISVFRLQPCAKADKVVTHLSDVIPAERVIRWPGRIGAIQMKSPDFVLKAKHSFGPRHTIALRRTRARNRGHCNCTAVATIIHSIEEIRRSA